MSVTRRPAWRDGATNGWHDDLVWYAAAIHRMRAFTPGIDDFYAILDGTGSRDPVEITTQWGDQRGLGYHAQVHGTGTPVNQWPTDQHGRTALWQECAHNQWFFLPWHRAYLLEFESVVREHIRDLGGPADDWGLPYWNYSDYVDDRARLGLPLPLQDPTLPDDVEVPGVEAGPDGTRPNPLFIPPRNVRPEEPPDWADATDCLLRPHYAVQQDTGYVSFGGGVLEHPNNAAEWHQESNELGMVDVQPHGSTHGHVGGAMNGFETAALDPVFWMHHCNIDRLWEIYAQTLTHGYPFENGVGLDSEAHTSWKERKFSFLRPDGSTATWTAPQVLDTGALGYGYESLASPPLPANPPPPPPGAETDPLGLAAPVPQPVAAADRVALTRADDVPLSSGSDDGVGVGDFPENARWILRFDNIVADRPVSSCYRVYLGLAPGQEADPDDASHFAGLLSFFGVYEASRDDGTSSGTGQRRRVDVTAQVRAQADTLAPQATSVRLVPLNEGTDLAAEGLTIGRVTLESA